MQFIVLTGQKKRSIYIILRLTFVLTPNEGKTKWVKVAMSLL